MIVVAGEALVDVAVSPRSVTLTPGGAPFNVARGCARLGAPTALLAAVSTDGLGQRLARELAGAGVDLRWIERTPLPTTLALAHVDAQGVAAYRFYVAGTSAPTLDAAALPAGASTFVTGGLGLALEPMASCVERLLHDVPDEVLVVVDVNARPAVIDDVASYRGRALGAIAPRADVLKVSDEDVAVLFPGATVREGAAELVAAGASLVLGTAGGGSTTLMAASGTAEVAVSSVAVVDTIGAGDAFTAGFTVWWREHGFTRTELADVDTVRRGVVAAHAVASIVVTRPGADPPTRADLPTDWSA